MDLDARVCYCFHVTRRKLLSFLRVERPRVASELSQCNGAGTGCGWCVPFLRQLFEKAGGATDLDTMTDQEYSQGRKEHIRSGKGRPPGGTTEETNS